MTVITSLPSSNHTGSKHLDRTVLNRLIAARHLIESSGGLQAQSLAPLVVAQRILIAHDAVELVLLALSSARDLPAKGKDGQLLKDPPFMVLARLIIKAATERFGLESRSQEKLLSDLVEARKLFKHDGLLVDASSNAHLFEDCVALANDLCACLLGEELLRIDQSAGVGIEETRRRFIDSRKKIVEGNYKASLEETGQGLAYAFAQLAVPTDLTVGKPSSEVALLLSGRGVDPSNFLRMQQLLPTIYFNWLRT